jgi:hypothetical protein
MRLLNGICQNGFFPVAYVELNMFHGRSYLTTETVCPCIMFLFFFATLIFIFIFATHAEKPDDNT